MFIHKHPYPPYFPEGATKMIVGTLPPPRFSMGELKPGDVNFCYGSIDGQLWPILNQLFELDLVFETTQKAIDQRKDFLQDRGIAICDIVHSAKRQKIDASDLGMEQVQLRPLLKYLKENTQIDTLLFTGGNSKNGPEYFFRRLLKEHELTLEVLENQVPRIHRFELNGRQIKTVSLTAPSGAANRAVGSLPLYKERKAADPSYNTLLFRVDQYRPFF
ncbi:uracil-DNA glycosylase family protein [Gilvibacter sp.]|uniref:uracil-DNA glycosylase family protein n=1 Tax=Gilvibacter sp. TaxID=2729997 RepID=UPI003F4A2DE6